MKKINEIKTLIVDDNEDLCEIIKSRFEIFNLQAFVAYSGKQAWEIFEQEDIDIVISDMCMENGGGLELLDRVRAQNSFYPRFYLFSGLVEFDREDIFHRGADGFFEKPFEASALMDVARKSALDARLRLSTPHGHEPSLIVKEKFESLAKAKKDMKLSLGRGGFYYQKKKNIPTIGQRVAFRFEFEEGDIQLLAGMGIVRWRRAKRWAKDNGIGVEFEFIDPDAMDEWMRWVEAHTMIPFIPKK